MKDHVKTLEAIANDPLNWSAKTREACRAGARAIREKRALDKLLKCWGTVEITDTKGDKT